MAKVPVSVTLSEENLLWLRARATAAKRRSLSDLLDALVTGARLGGHGPAAAARSVVGTVDISPDDPDLASADEAIASLFARSLSQPVLVGDRRSADATRPAARSVRHARTKRHHG